MVVMHLHEAPSTRAVSCDARLRQGAAPPRGRVGLWLVIARCRANAHTADVVALRRTLRQARLCFRQALRQAQLRVRMASVSLADVGAWSATGLAARTMAQLLCRRSPRGARRLARPYSTSTTRLAAAAGDARSSRPTASLRFFVTVGKTLIGRRPILPQLSCRN